jgi:hypothetical protein
MSLRPLATHLIKTPAFAVALIAELFNKIPRIEMGASWAMLMNVAIVSELRPPLMIGLR